MAYEKLRTSTIKSNLGNTWIVEVWQKDYTGSSSDMTLQGEGFEIKWSSKKEVAKTVFQPSELNLNFIVQNSTDEDWLRDDLFSKGSQHHFIRVYKGSVVVDNLWWFGWMEASFSALENAPFPYIAKLTATDSYGYYNKVGDETLSSYEFRDQPRPIANLQWYEFINYMDLQTVAQTGTIYNVKTIRNYVDWWSDDDTGYGTQDPFFRYATAPAIVTGEDKYNEDGEVVVEGVDRPLTFKKSDHLNQVLNLFGAVGVLSEGRYWFYQPNSFIGNTTGNISVYDHNLQIDNTPNSINVGLEVSDSNNTHILAGGDLIYEPSIKSVEIVNKRGNFTIQIGDQQDLTTEQVYGGLATGNFDNFTLDFYARHNEVVNKSEFTFDTDYYLLDKDAVNSLETSTVKTTFTLVVKISDGTTNKFLKQNSDNNNNLVWTTTVSSITITRGFSAYSSGLPTDTTEGFVPNVGWLDQVIITEDSSTFYVKSLLRFVAQVPDPGISGQISIELDADNYYYQGIVVDAAIGEEINYANLPSQPTITSEATTSVNITLNPISEGLEFYENSPITFESTQSDVPAAEVLELDNINVGENFINKNYSVQKQTNNVYNPIGNFVRGNPASSTGKNINHLRTEEALALRAKQLEVLQARVYSDNISPTKYLIYDIDGEGTYKYYLFKEGTFKARSDVMDGEWYNVPDTSLTITNTEYEPPTPPTSEPNPESSPSPVGLGGGKNISLPISNQYGFTANDITLGSSVTSITLAANTRGLIKSGQKILLTDIYGRYPVELTTTAETNTSSKVLSVSSFTANYEYSSGSIISPLSYDLTNVISGEPGGSNTQVQFNDSGAFGGDSDFTYNKTTNTLTVPNLAVEDVDVTGVSNALTVNCDSGNVGIYVISTDSIATIRFEDSATNDVIIAGAEGDDFFIRTDDGGFKIKTQENATTALEVTAAGELKTHNIGNIFDTEAYLTPVDFTISDNTSYPVYSRTNGGDSELNNSATSAFATFQVPLGYEATHVAVYGSSTSSTFDVYSCTVTTGTASSLTSSPSVGSNQSLSTAQSGVTGKYLTIKYSPGATGRKVYGAKITLART